MFAGAAPPRLWATHLCPLPVGILLKIDLNVGAALLRGDLPARIGRRSEIGSHLPVFMLRGAALRAMRALTRTPFWRAQLRKAVGSSPAFSASQVTAVAHSALQHFRPQR